MCVCTWVQSELHTASPFRGSIAGLDMAVRVSFKHNHVFVACVLCTSTSRACVCMFEYSHVHI